MAGQQIDYFELLEVPSVLEVDLQALKSSYYKKSLEVHPDHHLEVSLDESALINEAYKTLKDEHSRVKYVLTKIGGYNLEKGNSLNPMFLMEMMELNEKVETVSSDTYPDLIETVDQQISDLRSSLSGLWSVPFSSWSSEDWDTLHRYNLESQYLLRVKKNLDIFASRL